MHNKSIKDLQEKKYEKLETRMKKKFKTEILVVKNILKKFTFLYLFIKL